MYRIKYKVIISYKDIYCSYEWSKLTQLLGYSANHINISSGI